LKPLRETFDPANADEREGAALLAQVGPLEPSLARRRRVLAALEARSGMGLRVLRPAIVGGIVLALATGASATAGRYWMRSRAALSAPEGQITKAAPPHRATHHTPSVEKVAAQAPTEAAPSENATTEVAAPVTPAPVPALGRAAKNHVTPSTALEAAPSPAAAALMVEAMQARRAGDLGRAGELVAEYRRKYPDGALQEEAQALSIEVAAARGDREAAHLAEQYLARFPRGRFRAQAERALQTSPR
jgi:hypothetical protein